jgi:hypothetical protein
MLKGPSPPRTTGLPAYRSLYCFTVHGITSTVPLVRFIARKIETSSGIIESATSSEIIYCGETSEIHYKGLLTDWATGRGCRRFCFN